MFRILFLLSLLMASVSCSKKDRVQTPAPIPDIINGLILEVDVTPINITTPDKGSLLIVMNSAVYRVEFNAVAQSQSNATLFFDTDSVLRPESSEFANLGKDVIAYNPVGPNEITIQFYDGRKVFGFFDPNTSFGGTFGEQLISQWRNPADPAKPNQKAREDISNFVRLYSDNNGSAPGIVPIYLLVQVSRQ